VIDLEKCLKKNCSECNNVNPDIVYGCGHWDLCI